MELLSWTVLFLLVALIAGGLGFSGISHSAVGIARILFLIFLVLFIFAMVRGL